MAIIGPPPRAFAHAHGVAFGVDLDVGQPAPAAASRDTPSRAPASLNGGAGISLSVIELVDEAVVVALDKRARLGELRARADTLDDRVGRLRVSRDPAAGRHTTTAQATTFVYIRSSSAPRCFDAPLFRAATCGRGRASACAATVSSCCGVFRLAARSPFCFAASMRRRARRKRFGSFFSVVSNAARASAGRFDRQQHVAEQLARGRDRSWRHRILLGPVFALGRAPHRRQRLVRAAVRERRPRRHAEPLDRDLLGPVAFAGLGRAAPRAAAGRRSRRARSGDRPSARRQDRARTR